MSPQKDVRPMLAATHRQAAEEIETSIAILQATPGQNRMIIEAAWLASFHWSAYGCGQKHGQHRENERGLASYLEKWNEPTIAAEWRELDVVREAGAFGRQANPSTMQQSFDLLRHIRTWATT